MILSDNPIPTDMPPKNKVSTGSLSFPRIALLGALSLSLVTSTFADGRAMLGDITKAQILIGRVMQMVDKYRELTITLEAPVPQRDNKGKYLLPYKADGEQTEWAGKSMNAAVGKVVGEKAGDMATNALASKIPFGGLAGGFMKKKIKETAAVTALGGTEYLQKTSELSFPNLNDYAVYLHVMHSKDANYKEVLATAIAVYPDLEGRFDGAIKEAYRTQAAKAGKKIE